MSAPLGINPDLNHLPPGYTNVLPPGLTPSDIADIFCKTKGTMPIPEMPEETFIPAISTWPDGRPLTHVFRVDKDSEGYHIMDNGVRRPVKVTWNGHFAESELIEEPKASISEMAKRFAELRPGEPDELVVELRRIADALETLAKASKGRTEILVVPPTLSWDNIDVPPAQP